MSQATVRMMAFSSGELKAIGGSAAEHHSVCSTQSGQKEDTEHREEAMSDFGFQRLLDSNRSRKLFLVL